MASESKIPLAFRKRALSVLQALLAGWVCCCPPAAAGQSPPSAAGSAPAQPGAAAKDRVVDPNRKPLPVILDGRVLFKIHSPIGPYSIEERTALTERRLRAIASEGVSVRDIATKNQAERTDVVLGNQIITSVFDADALEVGQARQDLAARYARAIREALEIHQSERTASSLARGAAFAILYTLLLLLVFRLLRRASAMAQGALINKIKQLDRERGREGVHIAPSGWLAEILLRAAEWMRAAILAVLLYAYLTLVFGQFPWTRGFAQTLLGYVTTRLSTLWSAFLAQIPNLVTILVIVGVVWILLKLIGVLFHEVERGAVRLPGFDPEWAGTTFKIVRLVGILLTIAACYPYLPGSQSPALQGVSVFFGLLISLGASSAVGNTISGVLMTYMRPFRVGDRVRIADTEGDVIEKNLLVTRVRTVKNVDITIPNSLMLSAHIVNFSARARDRGLILHTTVTIGYDVPWRKVHQLLLSAAGETEGVLKDPEPFVLQTSLNDFHVSYQINVYTDRANAMAQTLSRLHANIQDAFKEANVEILSPTYHSVRDGNQSTVPLD